MSTTARRRPETKGCDKLPACRTVDEVRRSRIRIPYLKASQALEDGSGWHRAHNPSTVPRLVALCLRQR
jgi:hypothetical protein